MGLGGNLGDRLATLRSALHQLHRHRALAVVRTSPIFETSPVGPSNEPFLNAVAELRTSVGPEQTLAILHEVEQGHGRVRRVRWEARTLDLDLLLFFEPGAERSVRIDTAGLSLPHPRIAQRDFVLQPLVTLLPALVLDGATLEARLEGLTAEARTVLRTMEATLFDPQLPAEDRREDPREDPREDLRPERD